ncbi:MAG: hypothetical protein ACYDBB_23245 [Armatimonadota bacterium]
MPSHCTLRMQFSPHQNIDHLLDELRRLIQVAPVDEFMFFFFAEEINDGHDTLERVREWITHSRHYRQAMAEAGIVVSLNPWHSLLHCDRGRTMKPGQSWQPMVDQRGRACQAVVCPLDPAWRTYFAETLRLYAQEGFRVIWIDDDIRFHNHSPLEWGGCFCPLHIAEFNQRAGVAATREEIVDRCTQPGTPHPWRSLWLDMWEETHLAMITHWRKIVEAAGCRLGLMSSAVEAHAAEGRRWEQWWQALAGDKPPIHRPHFWGYGDMMGNSLPNAIAMLEQNRLLQPPGTESGPEIECFPYGKWNKSFRQTGAQMALAHILGSTNLNISLYDFMGNDPSDEPERATFLADWRPTLDWLADEFPLTLTPTGIGLPWSQEMGRAIHTRQGGYWQELSCPSRGWTGWLGAAGQAFTMRPSPAINAIAGPVAWSFSDEELRNWLSHGVLLDGAAAQILIERGMGDLIGMRQGRFVTQNEILYSIEQCLDPDFSLRPGAQISVNAGDYATPYSSTLLQGELLAGTRLISDLRGPSQQVVGHGVVICENALGGRVAIAPWRADNGVSMNVQRVAQFTKLLHWLDPHQTHGWVEGGAWLVPQFLTDGQRWRGVVWNAGPDAVEEIIVHLPAGMPTPTVARQIDGRGKRIPAEIDGNRIRLRNALQQWELVVLM